VIQGRGLNQAKKKTTRLRPGGYAVIYTFSPVDGYYECKGLAPMDGSRYYLCLDDGMVFRVLDRPDILTMKV